MNRSRALFAAVLSVVLLAAATPALKAQTAAQPQTTMRSMGGDWLNAAWSWLAQALGMSEEKPTARQEKLRVPNLGETPDSGPNGGARPMNGSCIDPNGCDWGG